MPTVDAIASSERSPRRIDIDAIVGGILLGGLLMSVATIVAGVAWHRLTTGTFRLDYALPGPNVGAFLLADLHELAAHATGPRRLINLGIGILLLTPYVRVLASMVYFAVVARDGKYAIFTGIVLTALTFSLFR